MTKAAPARGPVEIFRDAIVHQFRGEKTAVRPQIRPFEAGWVDDFRELTHFLHRLGPDQRAAVAAGALEGMSRELPGHRRWKVSSGVIDSLPPLPRTDGWVPSYTVEKRALGVRLWRRVLQGGDLIRFAEGEVRRGAWSTKMGGIVRWVVEGGTTGGAGTAGGAGTTSRIAWNLADQFHFLTGATSGGIGERVAGNLVAAGADVYLVSSSGLVEAEKAARRIARRLKGGGKIHFGNGDVVRGLSAIVDEVKRLAGGRTVSGLHPYATGAEQVFELAVSHHDLAKALEPGLTVHPLSPMRAGIPVGDGLVHQVASFLGKADQAGQQVKALSAEALAAQRLATIAPTAGITRSGLFRQPALRQALQFARLFGVTVYEPHQTGDLLTMATIYYQHHPIPDAKEAFAAVADGRVRLLRRPNINGVFRRATAVAFLANAAKGMAIGALLTYAADRLVGRPYFSAKDGDRDHYWIGYELGRDVGIAALTNLALGLSIGTGMTTTVVLTLAAAALSTGLEQSTELPSGVTNGLTGAFSGLGHMASTVYQLLH